MKLWQGIIDAVFGRDKGGQVLTDSPNIGTYQMPLTDSIRPAESKTKVTAPVISELPGENVTRITHISDDMAEPPAARVNLPPFPIQIEYNIEFSLKPLPASVALPYVAGVGILPPIPTFGTAHINNTCNLVSIPIALPFRNAFMATVRDLLNGKVESYYDTDRILKTLLNFGTEYQSLMTNWKYDSTDSTGHSIIVKLYKPLPPEITTKTYTYITRELAYPVVDKLYIIEAPAAPPTVYLRPPNKKLSLTGQYGTQVSNVTYETLFSTGAFDDVQPQDRVMEEWYITSLEGVELNVDYSNFKNFVFYGSAQKRLEAFKNKLSLIEQYSQMVTMNSDALGSFYTGSSAYNSIYNIAQKKQDMIRSFDGYERFLYYSSSAAMSGSFSSEPETDDQDIFVYYADATWPKIGGTVASVTSSLAEEWYIGIQEIAASYDAWNVNRFVNNLPEYLVTDAESEPYIRFFDLTGHMFDTVKLYINHMPDMHLRNNDVNTGISHDLIWDVAKGFGINLPNQYAVESLFNFAIGGSKIYRQSAAETWKRILHNHMFMMKTKGTKASLTALLNAYGINATSIQIRETSTPSNFYATQSFENYEEQTIALRQVFTQVIETDLNREDIATLNSGSKLEMPWSSSIGNTPISVQIRFALAPTATHQAILSVGNQWAIVAVPAIVGSSGSYSRIEYWVTNGWASIPSSGSYISKGPILTHQDFLLGEDKFYSLMVVNDPSGNIFSYFKKADNDGDLIINDVKSGSSIPGIVAAKNAWEPQLYSEYVQLGGQPLHDIENRIYIHGMTGLVDEFRVWGERITEETFDRWVKYPGLYNGNTLSSSAEVMWARASFNQTRNLFATASYPNESPHQRRADALASMADFSAIGFEDKPLEPCNMYKYTRTVQRLAPSAGGSQYDSNKVIVVDPPIFTYGTQDAPILRTDKSIVPLTKKVEEYRKNSNVVGLYFSATSAVNDSIIRSIGNVDLQDYIGNPQYIYSPIYTDLNKLNKFYWSNYAYTFNQNKFIDFVKNMMGPLFDQAKELVPARVKLLTGIVIEPHILERYRYPLKPLNLEKGDMAVSYSLDRSETLTGEYDNLIIDIPMGSNTKLDGALSNQSSLLQLSNQLQLNTEYADNFGYIQLSNQVKLGTDYQNLGHTINTATASSLAAEMLDNSVSYNIYDDVFRRVRIKASLFITDCLSPLFESLFDANNPESTTYFTNPNGYIAIPSYTYVRSKDNILNDKGYWMKGHGYSKNDVVSQSFAYKDDREFYAIRDNFISNTEPLSDRLNWRPVTYVAEQGYVIKKAVLVDEKFTIAPMASTKPIVVGYRPQHYRNFSPKYTAFKRARYTGCVQDNTTTMDKTPSVVVLMSSGDKLVVTQGREPIVRRDDTAGPRLDVK